MDEKEKKDTALTVSTPTCQVCGESLSQRAVVLCRRCSTPHHLECWRFNKGCSMYGCGSRISQKPPTELELNNQGPFVVKAGRVRTTSITGREFLAFFLPFLFLCFGSIYLESSPIIFATVAFYVFVLFGSLLKDACEHTLFVSPEEGLIDRTTTLLGMTVKSEKAWLKCDEMVELHVQREVQMTAHGTRIFQNLYALTKDGERKPLYGKVIDPVVDKGTEIEVVAEKLATCADCTVREFDAGVEPTSEELQEAIAQLERDKKLLPEK